MHFGQDEGLNYDTLPDEKKQQIDDWNYSPEGGETWALVDARMREFLQEKFRASTNSVVFSHGGAICALTFALGLEEMVNPGGVVAMRATGTSQHLDYEIEFVWEHPKIDLSDV